MNIFRPSRKPSSTKVRLTSVVASIAWLGFLLQPCVMASPNTASNADRGVEFSIVTHHGPGVAAEKCLHCSDASDLLPDVCNDNAGSGSYSSPKSFDNGADHGYPAAATFSLLDSVRIALVPSALPRSENLPPPIASTEAYCVYLE